MSEMEIVQMIFVNAVIAFIAYQIGHMVGYQHQ